MEGNTREIHIGSERELYKYINFNHHAGTSTKVRSKHRNKMSTEDIQYIGTRNSGIYSSKVAEKDTNYRFFPISV